MSMRTSWEGYLKFNLLSIPVKAYSTAVSGRDKITFHQIHADCGERIHHKKVCPVHGEVTKEEVVSGYEQEKGHYVLVEPDELKKLRAEDEKAINIETFVMPDAIPSFYSSGRSHFLTPDGKVGQRPYAVLQRVMKEDNRHAVGRMVLAGRQHLVRVEPVGDLLLVTQLNFDEQVKKPATFQDEVPDLEVTRKEMELAQTLVQASTEDHFNIAQFHDEYQADLAKLVEAKSKGKKLSRKRSADEPTVINLMDALRKSLDQKKQESRKNATHRAARRKTG